MSAHNRRGSRTKSTDTGTIKLGWFKNLKCPIRDVSPGGARIVLDENTELPEEFELRIPQFKHPRNCILRWVSGSEVGVEFVLE